MSSSAAPRRILSLRPVSAVHRLDARSEACPLSLREIARALGHRRATLLLVAAPLPAVARGALLAAAEASAVLGLALAPGIAPESWFGEIARDADELAPRLPFFLSGEVRGEDFDGDEAVEAGLVGFVNLGHAAAPEALLQLVFAEYASREVGHRRDYR